mmetsp:Transcript_5102/g.7451  ORF Transcript_5102/g.7451 Transcript_5102/m.7451 type:complete len:229 (-) Transcript_5102:201-887(-)
MTKSKKEKQKFRQRERFHAETAGELSTTCSEQDETSDVGHRPSYHFFWNGGSPFSQWRMSRYHLDGFSYICAEQGMMHGKALLFDDQEAAQAIMGSNCPRRMKALGQQVKGFKQKIWNGHKENIVYRNSIAKFTQNKELRKALLGTTGALVEASPSDKIWGIGLHENDARLIPESQWPGSNLLGKILTRVRDELQSGMHADLIDDEQETEISKDCDEKPASTPSKIEE